MWNYTHTDELQHWGIKGMKWGVRRSEAQLARARGDGDSSNNDSEDHKTASAIKKKRVSEMSNKELETLTRRMQLEQNYANLSAPKVSKGKKIIMDVLTEVGKETCKNFLKDTLKNPSATMDKFEAILGKVPGGDGFKSKVAGMRMAYEINKGSKKT